MIVKLAPHEVQMAAGVAIQRRVASLRQGCQDRHGYDGSNAWQQEIESTCAELAVAKALNAYWDGSVNTFKRGDVGNVQVRFTHHDRGRLLMRAGDPDNDVYVLVVGIDTVAFRVVGWIRGNEARRAEWRRRPDPGRPSCWAVPQDQLNPDLRELQGAQHAMPAREGADG